MNREPRTAVPGPGANAAPTSPQDITAQPAPDITPAELAHAQQVIHRVNARHARSAPAAVSSHLEHLRTIAADTLLPHARRRAAALPPGPEQDNWNRLITGSAHAAELRPPLHRAYQHLQVLTAHLREVLLALRQPTPEQKATQVRDLAQRIAHDITEGEHPPGTLLSARNLTGRYSGPGPLLRSALLHLADTGTLLRRGNRLLVPHQHRTGNSDPARTAAPGQKPPGPKNTLPHGDNLPTDPVPQAVRAARSTQPRASCAGARSDGSDPLHQPLSHGPFTPRR